MVAAHRSPECCEVAAWLRWLARLRPPALRAAAEPPRERIAIERPDADAAKRTWALLHFVSCDLMWSIQILMFALAP